MFLEWLSAARRYLGGGWWSDARGVSSRSHSTFRESAALGSGVAQAGRGSSSRPTVAVGGRCSTLPRSLKSATG